MSRMKYAALIFFQVNQRFKPFTALTLFLMIPMSISAENAGTTAKPGIVNVGALLAYNSTIGKVAKKAIELAVEDVNGNKSVLSGTRLVLTMMDSTCSAFMGTVAGVELMKKDTLAIVGPQSSVLAHVVAHIANEVQVPLLSFAATDPTISSYQYPYFLRMTHTDSSVMAAIAAVIGYYGWREIVAVYIDNDYGRNGISALDDALGNARAEIVYKAGLAPGVSTSEIGNVLQQLNLMEARVFVVHMEPGAGMNFFSEVKHFGMLSSGYAWIATDWLSSVLYYNALDSHIMNSLQGVLSLRRHTPNSDRQHGFTVRWNDLHEDGIVDSRLNVFGLYAYDAVWAVAYSIDTFLSEGGNISFVDYPQLSNASGRKSELAELKVFIGGRHLRMKLLQTKFAGLTGPIQLDNNGNLIGSTFEIINIAGTGFRKVSYWSNQFGLSVAPPESISTSSNNQSSLNQEMNNVIWPGDSKLVPRGWAFSNNGRRLVIGVPRKLGFQEFVTTVEGTNIVKGFCIDVFVAALRLLPYAVPYTFVPFGSGNSDPIYDELVEQVALKNFDAAVGDIAIVTNRSKIVDFTQPYIESGLVVVTPIKEIKSNAWSFLQPFTPDLWGTTCGFLIFIGVVVWILEHGLDGNSSRKGVVACILEHGLDGNSSRKGLKHIGNILWLGFSTLFLSLHENVETTLGRAVVIIWLFVVLIISSSYTACLTSILTVQRLSPTIQGISDLIPSNVPIGYQTGSFVRSYLSEQLNIAQSRLVPLDSPERYAEALSLGPNKGGVAAIVDELPDVQLFLSTHCGFAMVGQEFTKSGWGFAFPKGSQLLMDISTAILNLSENGELQRIHDKWLSQKSCSSQTNLKAESSQLRLRSFLGLFLTGGATSLIAILGFLCLRIHQFTHSPSFRDANSCAAILRHFLTFLGEREKEKKLHRGEAI